MSAGGGGSRPVRPLIGHGGFIHPAGGREPFPLPPQPPVETTKCLCEGRLNPTDPDAVSDVLAEVRRALSELSDTDVRVVLVQKEDDA